MQATARTRRPSTSCSSSASSPQCFYLDMEVSLLQPTIAYISTNVLAYLILPPTATVLAALCYRPRHGSQEIQSSASLSADTSLPAYASSVVAISLSYWNAPPQSSTSSPSATQITDNRLGGSASGHVSPRYENGPPNYLQAIAEMPTAPPSYQLRQHTVPRPMPMDTPPAYIQSALL